MNFLGGFSGFLYFLFLSGKRLKKPKEQLHSNRKLERWISEALSLFFFFNYEVFIKGECNYQTLLLFTNENAVY